MNKEIIEAVNKLFISVDNRDWELVKKSFDETVLLDYTSIAGGEPANLTASQIIDSWKGLLPGFDKTHHQLGNYLVETDSQKAKVFCYGLAAHYLVNESKNNIWTVVGSYDFELKHVNNYWRISKMKFNLKYIDGNNDLPRIAQEKIKKIN
ncbi:MAG: nuclear transport factor 2 family protein [Ignavibacteria bacterium]